MSQFLLDPESEFGKRLVGYYEKLMSGIASIGEIEQMDALARQKLDEYGYKYVPTEEFGKYRLVSSIFLQLEKFQKQGIELFADVTLINSCAIPKESKIIISLPTLFDKYVFGGCLRHEAGHIDDYRSGFRTVDDFEALSRRSVIRTPPGLYAKEEVYNFFDEGELFHNWGDLEEVIKFLFTRKKIKPSIKKPKLNTFFNLINALDKFTININQASFCGINISNYLATESLDEVDMAIDSEKRCVGLCLDDRRQVFFGRLSKEPIDPYVVQIPYYIDDKKGMLSIFLNNPEYMEWIDRLIEGRTIVEDPGKILIDCYQEKVLPQLLLQNRESLHSNLALQVIKKDISLLTDPLNIQGREWRTADGLREFVFRASLRRGYNSRRINLEALYGQTIQEGSEEILRRFVR